MSLSPPDYDKKAGKRPTEDAEPQKARTALVEKLFREHNEALLRFVRARVHSQQEALEVTQEAYVRMLSLDEPGAVSYLRTFLFRTAANIAVDRQRRLQTRERAADQPQLWSHAELRTPERVVAGEQLLQCLSDVLESMPAKCRQSFVWHQIHGISADIIANRLGITESMVRKYVVRALLHCRERMDLEELEPVVVARTSGDVRESKND